MQGILTMLPKVNRELLATYLDGFKKEGWIYKEAQHHSGWQRRWMVLWPKTPHPSFGQLLVYFRKPEDREARGVSTLRHAGAYCLSVAAPPLRPRRHQAAHTLHSMPTR